MKRLMLVLSIFILATWVNAQVARMQQTGDEVVFGVADPITGRINASDIFIRIKPDKTVVFSQGSFRKNINVIDNTSTATTRQLLISEIGSLCLLNTVDGLTTGTVSFKLPANADIGSPFTFVNENPTSGTLTVIAPTGEKINGGTVSKKYVNSGASEKESVFLVKVDSTNWRIISELGTWANDNN